MGDGCFPNVDSRLWDHLPKTGRVTGQGPDLVENQLLDGPGRDRLRGASSGAALLSAGTAVVAVARRRLAQAVARHQAPATRSAAQQTLQQGVRPGPASVAPAGATQQRLQLLDFTAFRGDRVAAVNRIV